MRSWICLILFFLIISEAGAQGKKGKPKIERQEYLATNEEQAITIRLSHLQVRDDDDWFYPWGFTLKLNPGSGYSINGDVVTPVVDFSGTLTVPVTVNDGEQDSDPFDLKITVIPINDKPVITGNSTLSTNENQAITILPGHLTVTDPDDSYPNDFSLKLLAGNNYTVDGSKAIPQLNFVGFLSVNLTVNDGEADSNPYALRIEVIAINHTPEIVNQSTLWVNEDESVTILFTHLIVVDADNHYPDGFSFTLFPGENYTVSNATVTPATNFYGKIVVPVTVNDGANTSKPFNLVVGVTPVNDPPEITNLETDPVFAGLENGSVTVSQNITAEDADGDSIMFAKVGFRSEGYHVNSDNLVYTPAPDSKIHGVFDPATGILTLLGQASPQRYTQAMRSVHYQAVITNQAPENKTIYFVVNDGIADSEAQERILQHGEEKVSLEIPTGFTPNGDFANDTWKIIPLKSAETYSNAQIKVYNRAGSVVYESTGFDKEWDGRMNGELLPADTYFYTIDLNLNTPNSYVKGLVTILR